MGSTPEQSKRYRAKYGDVITERKRLYYLANKERLNTKSKLYYKENTKQISEVTAKYRLDNIEAVKLRESEYRIKHKEQRNSKNREYKRLNKGIVNANKAYRKARKLQATPRWANLEEIKSIYTNCPSGYHVDHIIPLNNEIVCGLHTEDNLQYLTKEENLKKGNSFIS